VSTPDVMLHLGCAEGGGIFANVVRSDYGPTFVFHVAKASQESFRSQDGKILGRSALGEKRRLGRLREARWQRKIVLRERRYRGGEPADFWPSGGQSHILLQVSSKLGAIAGATITR
jgi:hypothetical protein